jgi:hypothetical protein
MRPTHPSLSPRHCRCWLAVILAVSLGLRIWLGYQGGERYWADETRYASSQDAVADLRFGQWHAAARELLGHPDHTLFRWFGVPPAFFENRAGPHPAVVAAYFSLYSVLAIYLIWAVARQAGGSDLEALWAAYLAACANSLFYYSRHYFPYDISLCAMLGALWLGLRPWSWRNSLLAGVMAGIGFLTYNGYWLLGGCVLALHALLGDGGRRRILARTAWSGAGLALGILPVVRLSRALGFDLVTANSQLSTIATGDFFFGRRVMAGYLWFAEGGLLVIWLAALAYALAGAWRDRRLGRLAWSVGGLVFMTAGLLGLTDIVPLFALQGRRVRCLVPFLCLGAAIGIVRFVQSRTRWRRGWTAGIAGLAAGFAVWNFSGPLRQIFPDGFLQLAAAKVAQQPGYRAYRMTFAQNLWGLPLDIPLSPEATILRRPHPMQFRPYQYEGYETAQRAEINRHDISMRLIALPGGVDGKDPRWRGYPGPVRFLVRFPNNASGRADPLLVTDPKGKGDLFYVVYVDANHVAFRLDYAQPHEIVLFAGFLLPPKEQGRDDPPELSRQRDHLVVFLDGHPVFSMAQAFYPAARSNISFGVNFVGGLMPPTFSGDILDFGPAPDSLLAPALALLAAGPSVKAAGGVHLSEVIPVAGSAGNGFPGPIRLKVIFPRSGKGQDPLLVSGATGAADFLYVHYEDDRHVRLGFDHWGVGGPVSEPVPIQPGAEQEFVISMGSLLPPADDPVYRREPGWSKLRTRLLVTLNGRMVLNVPMECYPSRGDQLFVGCNPLGGSTTTPIFLGRIVSGAEIPAAQILQELAAGSGP